MNDFIIYLVITSLWIFGVYAVFDSRHLLGKVGGWVMSQTSETLCRPLFRCPVCMSSVHGGLFGVVFYDFTLTVLPFIICLAGLNFIINSLLPEYD